MIALIETLTTIIQYLWKLLSFTIWEGKYQSGVTQNKSYTTLALNGSCVSLCVYISIYIHMCKIRWGATKFGIPNYQTTPVPFTSRTIGFVHWEAICHYNGVQSKTRIHPLKTKLKLS